MKENTISDYFDEKWGSGMWPPLDKDKDTASPCNTYTCKICGWEFSERLFGSFSQHDPDPFEEVKRKQREHFDIHVAKGEIE